MRRLHQALSGRNAGMTRHAAELRTEVSVRWTSGTLADVMSTAATYAVQTLDGLQFMAVPLQQLTSSIDSWLFRCDELSYGRDNRQLPGRSIDMAAQALNECGVSVDRICRRLARPSTMSGRYRWEERASARLNGMYFVSLSPEKMPHFICSRSCDVYRCLSCITCNNVIRAELTAYLSTESCSADLANAAC